MSLGSSAPRDNAFKTSPGRGVTWIFKVSGATKGVEFTPVRAEHDNSVGRNLLTDSERTNLDRDNLTAYVGDANGYVIAFTNGLKVYLSADIALMAGMKTIINGFIKSTGSFEYRFG